VHITIPLYTHADPKELAEILERLHAVAFSMAPELHAPSATLAAVGALVPEHVAYLAVKS